MFQGESDAAAILRGIDWHKHAAGAVETWPVQVRTAISLSLGTPSAQLVVWGELAFANDRWGAGDPRRGVPPVVRDAIAKLPPDWTAAGRRVLPGIGVALPVLADNGALVAVVIAEDRAGLQHRLRQAVAPMLLAIDAAKRGAPEGLAMLEAQTRELATAVGDRPAMSSAPEVTGAPQRILVVEDHDPTATALRAALVSLGHDVELAHDAAIALVLAKTFAPQLVLLDIGLPIIDGWELAARLRELGVASARFVAITGRGEAADRARSRDAGFADHVVKPVDLQQLIRIVQSERV